MLTIQRAIWQAAFLGKWTARILGTLAFLFFLALVLGEGPPNLFRLSLQEDFSLLLMTAVFLGLILAWLWEEWGGGLTLAAFAGLLVISHTHLHTAALRIPVAIGALHLLCWSILKTKPTSIPSGFAIPRSVVFGGASLLGLFLLICANEIFGNPPFLTPTLRPDATLTGTWASGETTLTIHEDTSVTGMVTGTISNNRTWFGKAMGWRTDYLIRGTASGKAVIRPFQIRGASLSGMGRDFRRIQ